MGNYINERSIVGLMNKNGIICTDYPLSFYKVKNKSKIVVCGNRLSLEEESKYKQVNYMYLDIDPKIKGSNKMTQVISEINSKEMFHSLPGKKYREIRETIHKYLRMKNNNQLRIEELNIDNYQDVINMIDEWEYSEKGGLKYMWQSHPGIDKNVINRYVNEELNNCFALIFYIDNKCVGYSCCEQGLFNTNNQEIKYLTRKSLNNYRNLTLFIDWYTFYILHLQIGFNNNFKINWGCSSKGVLDYKVKKWPVYSLEDKWFLTIKNT